MAWLAGDPAELALKPGRHSQLSGGRGPIPLMGGRVMPLVGVASCERMASGYARWHLFQGEG